MDLSLPVYALELPAAVLAWVLAARWAGHKPVAWLLSIGLGGDVARRVLRWAVLIPAHAAMGQAPLAGWARVAGHLESALFLAWPAALAAAAIVVFQRPGRDGEALARARRPVLAVAGVWALVVCALAVAYPAARGGVLARCFLAAELAAIVVGLGSIIPWIALRRTPQASHVSIALVIAGELVSVLAGPWRTGVFNSWLPAQAVYVALFGVLVLLQGGGWWMSSSSSS